MSRVTQKRQLCLLHAFASSDCAHASGIEALTVRRNRGPGGLSQAAAYFVSSPLLPSEVFKWATQDQLHLASMLHVQGVCQIIRSCLIQVGLVVLHRLLAPPST